MISASLCESNVNSFTQLSIGSGCSDRRTNRSHSVAGIRTAGQTLSTTTHIRISTIPGYIVGTGWEAFILILVTIIIERLTYSNRSSFGPLRREAFGPSFWTRPTPHWNSGQLCWEAMVFAVFEVEIVAAEDEVTISPSFFRQDLVLCFGNGKYVKKSKIGDADRGD